MQAKDCHSPIVRGQNSKRRLMPLIPHRSLESNTSIWRGLTPSVSSFKNAKSSSLPLDSLTFSDSFTRSWKVSFSRSWPCQLDAVPLLCSMWNLKWLHVVDKVQPYLVVVYFFIPISCHSLFSHHVSAVHFLLVFRSCSVISNIFLLGFPVKIPFTGFFIYSKSSLFLRCFP